MVKLGRRAVAGALVALCASQITPAVAACRFVKIATFPVEIKGKVPTNTRRHGSTGKRELSYWIATFDRVVIGNEAINRAKLAVVDMWAAARADINNWAIEDMAADAPEVVLGADFLHAHRVLFALSQRKFYFSYLGGKVFATEP
jgi:hypothetical protein